MDGAEGREVLERHLRRAVLADRDACMRAAELDRRARLIAAMRTKSYARREERGEGRGERLPAAHLEPNGCRDQLLLGDEHLEVALGVRLAKISANVEFETSPSSATTSPRPSPSALSASPYALRVATSSPSSYARQLELRRSRTRAARPRTPASPRRRRCCGSRRAPRSPPRGRRAAFRASPPCSRPPSLPCP